MFNSKLLVLLTHFLVHRFVVLSGSLIKWVDKCIHCELVELYTGRGVGDDMDRFFFFFFLDGVFFLLEIR